jgi:hypothetical protein
MKAENYISLFGKLHFFKVYWRNDLDISVFDFLENNPDYELNDNEINRIYSNETYSLYEYLKGFKDGRELISQLRLMFDDYRSEGGEALFWLHFTYENISLNPLNYPTEFVGLIESNLLLWIENFTKMPYDYLQAKVNYLNSKDNKQVDEFIKITNTAFALFCSVVHQCGLDLKSDDESNSVFCQKIADKYKIQVNVSKARQTFTTSMDIKKTDKKLLLITNKILPKIDSQLSKRIKLFIDSKINLYA